MCEPVPCYRNIFSLLFQLRNVDFDKNEHRTPQFFLMNPLHQVPTLNDNGFLVTDSHAIISYLAANSSLMSTDPRLLARINQLLFFDFELFRVMGEVGVSSRNIAEGQTCLSEFIFQIPLLSHKAVMEPSQKALAIMFEKLDALEHYLKQRVWVSGEFLTIADFSVLATFSAIYVRGSMMLLAKF